MSSSWEGDRQHAVLEEVAARTAPVPGNEDIDELLDHVDTGATVWTAVRRPPPDAAAPSDPAADWLSEDLASLLGARPDAIYAAANITESVQLDAGARYSSDDKAERVLQHVQDYLKLRRSAPGPRADLSGYPPAVRQALERALARGGGGSALRRALLDNVKVDRRGRYVTFRLSLSATTIDEMLSARSPRDLIDEVNGWLPDALKPPLIGQTDVCCCMLLPWRRSGIDGSTAPTAAAICSAPGHAILVDPAMSASRSTGRRWPNAACT
jgi:hypothetical protein